MITVDQIRSVLKQVVLSKISLDDFDEWLTKASWNMHKDSSADAIQAVGRIELRLAEADSQEISLEDLVQKLLASLPSVEMSNVDMPVTIRTSGFVYGNSVNLPLVQWAASDKSLAVEFVSAPPVPV